MPGFPWINAVFVNQQDRVHIAGAVGDEQGVTLVRGEHGRG